MVKMRMNLIPEPHIKWLAAVINLTMFIIIHILVYYFIILLICTKYRVKERAIQSGL